MTSQNVRQLHNPYPPHALSASSAAGGAMSAEGAMSNALANVKAIKSDEIKECFELANSINRSTHSKN